MPIYEYQCDACAIRIEKLWSRPSLAENEIPCPECSEAMRKLVSAASFAFKHGEGQTTRPLPPNTGTSDDWNFDKAIGRDADQKWGQIEERGNEKDKVIKEERVAGRAVTRDHLVPKKEGGFRTITEPERKRANENRKAAFDIAHAAKKSGES